MADDRVTAAQQELQQREAEARRLTLRRDGARPIGVNLEEGAALAKQATTIVGFALRDTDAGAA